MAEVAPVLDVLDRQLRRPSPLDHPREQGIRRFALVQRLPGVGHEMPQHLAHRMIDEEAVPIDMQQRRNPHPAEEQLLLREAADVMQLFHHRLRQL